MDDVLVEHEVDDPSEPVSPETSFSKHEHEQVRVHDGANATGADAGEVLGEAELGKTAHGVNADGVKLTFA